MRWRLRKVPERGGRGEGELGENTCREDRRPTSTATSAFNSAAEVVFGEEGGGDVLEGGGGGEGDTTPPSVRGKGPEGLVVVVARSIEEDGDVSGAIDTRSDQRTFGE